MRKLVLALASAAALSLGTTAQATVTIVDTSDEMVVTPVVESPLAFTFGYTEADTTSPFTSWVTWTSDTAFTYGISLISFPAIPDQSGDLDFTAAYVTGTGIVGQINLLPAADSTDALEHYSLNTFLGTGTFTLTIEGTRVDLGSFGGTVTGLVPEPGTWAMMLIGFGAVAYQMRRRRRLALMQMA